MDPLITSSLISAGSSLLGGLFGKKDKGPSVEDQLMTQRGSIFNTMKSTLDAAKEYGVHPLVALGLNPGAGGASISLGDNSSSRSTAGDLINEMGQNIAGAVGRMQSPDEKGVQQIVQRQAVEKGELENELLKTQIAQMRANITPGIANTNSGQMIPGQADTTATYGPNTLVAHESADGKEGGTPSSWTVVNTKTGPMVVPSKDFQDRAEDIPFVGWEWMIRNKAPELAEMLMRSGYLNDFRKQQNPRTSNERGYTKIHW